MNTRQKVVVWCALGLLLLAVLFPPWLSSYSSRRIYSQGPSHQGFHFVFTGSGTINVALLTFECFVIVGVAAVILYMLRTPRDAGPPEA